MKSYFYQLVCLGGIVALIGCHPNIKNAKYLVEKNNQLALKTFDALTFDSIYMYQVMVDKQLKPLKEVIDFESFDLLVNFPEDSILIRNPYYFKNKNEHIFKDKKYLYFVSHDSINGHFLKRICRINEYQLLGGEYIRIGNEIYFDTRKVIGADVNSFTTTDIIQKSEWLKTLGRDNLHYYISDRILTKDKYYLFLLDSSIIQN